MELINQSKWHIFDPFSIDINKFTIITGLNGSGKTQLLKAVADDKSSIHIVGGDSNKSNIKYVGINSLIPSIITTYNHNNSYKPIDKLLDIFKSSKEEFMQYSSMSMRYEIRPDAEHNKEVVERTKKRFFPNQFQLIAKRCNKDILSLTNDDIRNNYSFDFGLPDGDMFSQSLGHTIGYYMALLEENELNMFRNKIRNKKQYKYYEDEEFIERYGANPIEKINSLLVKYEFSSQLVINNNNHDNIDIEFVDKVNNLTVPPNEMSSGEKVILSLIIAIYNRPEGTPFPKVLLLDEPDASLHPSLIRTFLNILKETFIDEMSMSIIMTTHSPSTIALAPDDPYIYALEKNPTSLTRLTPDQAIRKLTEGIPTLSVKIENRRFVFVESKFDVQVLSKIYNRIRNKLDSDFSLDFIPSGSGSRITGDCEQVKHLVKSLQNENIFGIIDNDNKNTSNENTFILGSRYSIENYLVDPIALAMYFIIEEIVKAENIDLPEYTTASDFKSLDSDILQKCSNAIIKLISPALEKESLGGDYINSSYSNGVTIKVPSWYLTYQGHDLADRIKGCFPKLRKLNSTDAFLNNIVSKVFESYPEMIPMEIVETIKATLRV